MIVLNHLFPQRIAKADQAVVMGEKQGAAGRTPDLLLLLERAMCQASFDFDFEDDSMLILAG